MLKKKKIPHTYVIIFYIIVVAAITTWLLPGGTYVETSQEIGGQVQKELVYKSIDNQPQTWEIFSAMFKGFVKQADIIVFILMIGGAFWIMNDCRAIDVGIFSFLKMTKRLEKVSFFRKLGVNNLIIVLIMLMFSVFGAVFGMSEETIAFIIIIVPLAIKMGYDSIMGVAMVFVAAGLGFAGAILNPFTIGIAQGIAELPLFSGLEYRLFCWLVINVTGIAYVLWYARKLRLNPQSSLVYNEDAYWRKRSEGSDSDGINYHTPKSAWVIYIGLLAVLVYASISFPSTSLKVGNSEGVVAIIPIITVLFGITGFLSLRKSAHFFVLNLLMLTIMFLIVGVMGYQWYVKEIATLFFAMGIFSGIAMNYNPDKITKLFLEGVKDILSAALIVGLAGGIIVILSDGKVIDTILHNLSKSMNDLGQISSVGIMYMIQTLINVVIPSGSAKAALTMPIMAPFSDLIGISRQATVMAFQFGDGFTNMITPTSGVLIGVLGVAKIPYEKWVKWIGPIMIVWIILGFLLLIPTVLLNLSGF
ncbi:MAG: YfcC family protein [Bacteroidales bacterium]